MGAILWHGVEHSAVTPRMGWKKRLRVLWAAVSQQWHTKVCVECGNDWLAVGSDTELIAICDRCEIQQMDRFAADMERKFQQEFKEAI